MSFKNITANIDNLIKLQQQLKLKTLNETIKLDETAQRIKQEEEKKEQIKIIENAKHEDLSIFLANLGYAVDKKKSSHNYRVMKNDNGDKVIIYKKGDKYLYFNPQSDADKGDIYNFFANRGIKSYKQISDIIKNANRNIDLQPLQIAKKSYQIDKAVTEYNNYYKNKTENNYSYLTNKRLIDKNIVKAYEHAIKSDKYGNIIVPLYLRENKFGMIGFDRRLKERTEDQPKSYINGKKGLAILQPKNFKQVENVVICENYIDGLSYIELNKLNPQKTAIVATMGTINKEELESIKEYMKMTQKHAKLNKITFAMDNDEAGWNLADKLEDELNEYKSILHIRYAKNSKKDFNAELKYNKLNEMLTNEDMREKYKYALSNDGEIKKAFENLKKEREMNQQQQHSRRFGFSR